MHVLDMIFFWANAKPNHPAIIQSGMIMTYRALAESIVSVSRHIVQSELDSAEPVAVSIEDPVRQLSVTLALVHSGFTAAPVNEALLPQLGAAGINTLISASRDEILLGGKNIQFSEGWLSSGSKVSLLGNQVPGKPHNRGNLIFFTSGTTGVPKKFIQTKEAFHERLSFLNLTGEGNYSRTLIVPGLPSSYGSNCAWGVLSAGKTVCFSAFGEPMLILIGIYHIEQIIASPQQALALAELVERNAGYQFDSLKLIRIGGGLISSGLVKRIQSKLCRNVLIYYGSTEAQVTALGKFEMLENSPGAVGFLAPGVELEIIDDGGNVLPADVEGFVRCRSPMFIKSISVNYPELQNDIDDIWFYPGDRGSLNQAGVLCIAGRGGDTINRGGVKISAPAMEEILLSCEGVKDAGVCGVRNSMGIDEVWIAIVADTNFDMLLFRRKLADSDKSFRLFDNSVDEIFSVDLIPRNELGKIKRHELRELLLNLKKQPRLQ